MSRHRRPRLEVLESRDIPGNLTVTYAAATHTLTVVGHELNNQLSVDGVAGVDQQFRLASTTDTFNGSPGPLTTPTGVRNLTIKMLGGDDSIDIGTSTRVGLYGNVKVAGADGVNSLVAKDLYVGGNLNVVNGSGSDNTSMSGLFVSGSVTVNNGAGDSAVTFYRNSEGLSLIRGTLTILNGRGKDENVISDMSVVGNVTVRNGRGDSNGEGGQTAIYNVHNLTTPSYIGGNVLVSNSDGDITNWLRDVVVLGNAAFNLGSGKSDNVIDNYLAAFPTEVRGNLTFTGSGPTMIRHGGSMTGAGMVVGKDFRVSTGAEYDQLYLFRAEVGGRTVLSLGEGDSFVSIDDAAFHGTLTLTTGSGVDKFFLETLLGTPAPTTFEKAATIRQGAGNDYVRLGDGTTWDDNMRIVFLAPVVIHYGAGVNEFWFWGDPIYQFNVGIRHIY